MRKIYPPPFNKFAIFVLYGLLSIATTLAQNGAQCGMSPEYGYATMGYINLNSLGDNKIPWKSYDYINVVVYPNDPWNNIHPGGDLTLLSNLVADRDDNKVKTKIFLSIRNYDPVKWPGFDNDAEYGKIVTETAETLNSKNLDGVDIEYPGMRGIYCGGWDDDREKKDDRFIKFLGDLKLQIPKKNLMLTVGKDIPAGKHTADLKGHIDFLNIETYHYSIYANIDNPPDPPANTIMSYPNAPFTEFENAYNGWTGTGIGEEKIIMGLDFGNTLQVLSNPGIAETQSVNTNVLDLTVIQDPAITGLNLKPIDIGLCSEYNPLNDKLHLYSFPWKDLSKSALDLTKCGSAISGWNYGPDKETPWLYKTIGFPNPQYYLYVSFEDFTSLGKKLEFVKGKVGGISISDVSYDDKNDSLLSFIHGKEVNSSNDPTGQKGSGQGNGNNNPSDDGNPKNPDNSADNNQPKEVNSDKPGPKAGTIIGAVIGSLLGSFIILGAGLFWYRNRNRLKSSSFKSLLNKSIPSSIRNHNIPGNAEMTDPSPNRFAPSTTVIPVASGYVTAMFDFTGKEENDLSFKKGDKIEILERGDGPNDWWVGRVNGAVGEFPGNYVKET